MQLHPNLLSTIMLPALVLGIAATLAPTLAAEADVSKCPAAKTWQEAYNKGDSAAVAALYTADAIEVTPDGIRVGPAAVKERVEESINKAGMKHVVITATKCSTEAAARWSAGEWKSDSPRGPVGGFWTAIETKNSNEWRMTNLTFSITPPPPPASK